MRAMDGGDLATQQRFVKGGDLSTTHRQSGGFLGFIGNLLGLGPAELQKRMSQPSKNELPMQRGGFPWALAGLSLLPMLMNGKGKDNDGLGGNAIQRQMMMARDPLMQRGGLSIPPALLAKGLPLLKSIGIPLAMGALASVGDNVVDKVFGDGTKTRTVRRKRQTHVKHAKRSPGKRTKRKRSSPSSSSSSSSSRRTVRGRRTKRTGRT